MQSGFIALDVRLHLCILKYKSRLFCAAFVVYKSNQSFLKMPSNIFQTGEHYF